ncbi:DUF757-domain-containing protein [Russula earlei]|uniref:DUF757-domain-containing protein n=1 Tax=Russula earlei TaxID=71964 RepID=A0ACC0U655_9AGAM|nr:DUF757-domain-containing protein [Russula earlei]
MAGTFDPNQAQNLVEIEKQFAVKAVEHAQTYWNLLEKISPRSLKLTRSARHPPLSFGSREARVCLLLNNNKKSYDDEIFEHTLRSFPEFAAPPHTKLSTLDEDWMKSDEGKERWRAFIDTYEKKIADFNFGSLIRTDATKEYSEKNTIFVTRIQVRYRSCSEVGTQSWMPDYGGMYRSFKPAQFFAIEISRNRLGLNDGAHEIAKEEARKEREKAEKKRAGKKRSDAL